MIGIKTLIKVLENLNKYDYRKINHNFLSLKSLIIYSNLGRLISFMEEKELISVTKIGREKLIKITDKGRKVLEVLKSIE